MAVVLSQIAKSKSNRKIIFLHNYVLTMNKDGAVLQASQIINLCKECKTMKKIAAVLLVLVMVLALCACGSSAKQDAGKKTLILGTSADYAPFEFMYPDDKGNLVYGGIDISVAQYIADYNNMDLQIENMGFDYLLVSLQKGDFDMVLAAIEETEERLQSADFSDPYYTDYPPMILVKAADKDAYTSLEDFGGKSVGAQTATTKEEIVSNDMPGANLVSLQNVNDLANQLINDKIDAVVLDGAVALQFVANNGDLAIASVDLGEAYPYRVAVAKGDPKGLLPGINAAIADMLEKGKVTEFSDFAASLEDVWQEVSAE